MHQRFVQEKLKTHQGQKEKQTRVHREEYIENTIRFDDTIVMMSNRLQILEEAIIKEQENLMLSQ